MEDRDEPLAPGASPATVDLPGRVILVVGPSGAGMEAPIEAARSLLAGDERWVFPRRIVTRPGPTAEGDIAADEPSFLQVRARGGFALAWTSQGRWYGVPAAVDADLARGARVVIGVARKVIAEARRRWPDVTVSEIATAAEDATPEALAPARDGDGSRPKPDLAAGRGAIGSIDGGVGALLSAVLAD
ncbi:MAG: phosphonate metabolism protein/1,5-bisphosphokinase (PRPP-forming) PhnN [Phyllobacteriaceae bacterium]|nr:phosphonate metabolism protein/1,5-bisphosphokinase (PRPP-forming) PhnN [Phyllobacteriaceae bacterium]